jgi:putative intracellular protease/amidase
MIACYPPRPRMAKKILIPLPDLDFDVTEVSVPWRILRDAGHELVFATEAGNTPAADPLLLRGVLFGKLGADPEPKAFYAAMREDPAFVGPRSWVDLDMTEYDALLLPGGHAQGMRQYLASEVLQRKVAAFWATGRPVAAICHGVLVLARSHDPVTGKSLLWGRKTTCLPAYMERLAYYLTAWKLGRYYRTYRAYVQTEVQQALQAAAHFVRGPLTLGSRGSAHDDTHAFIVEDGNYLSARWPGDAYLLGRRLVEVLARHTGP